MTDFALFFPDVRMTELGKIKIGGLGEERTAKSGAKYRMPEKYNHFVITTMNRDAQGRLVTDTELMNQLKEKYADPTDGELRQLPVYLLSNEIEDVMQVAYVAYSGKSVGARSDGKTVTWFKDRKTGQKLAEPVEEPWSADLLDLKNSQGGPLFKMHAVFNCVIGAKEARWGGVYKLRTTSVITAKQLYQGLIHLAQLTNGILVGLPLYLIVRPMQVSPEGKVTTVYVVHVEMRGAEMAQIMDRAVTMARMLLERKKEMGQIQAQYRKMLVAPGFETNAEVEEINEEFQPDTAQDETLAPSTAGDFVADLVKGAFEAKKAEEVQEVEVDPVTHAEPGREGEGWKMPTDAEAVEAEAKAVRDGELPF